MRQYPVLIIGAGQAGLAAAWHLKQHHIDFLMLEASERPGGAWRHYYDSLELFSPAAYSSLPGLAFPGAPAHYPHRDEVVDYLEDYADTFQFPIQTGAKVVDVAQSADGFEVRTLSGHHYRAKALVVASGAFCSPHLPQIPGQAQFQGRILHSSDYRSPQEFRGQRVIVIGAANSAVQIAHELSEVAQVSLATRAPVRFFPQRVLGQDFHFWMKWTGLDKTRWLSDQSTPVLDSGKYRHAIKTEQIPRLPMFTQIKPHGVGWDDGTEEQVDVLLFATGFRPSLSFLGELGGEHTEVQRNGVARHIDGLYFVGFPKQRNFASATLRGVGPDAAYIMPHLLKHLRNGELRHNAPRRQETQS